MNHSNFARDVRTIKEEGVGNVANYPEFLGGSQNIFVGQCAIFHEL